MANSSRIENVSTGAEGSEILAFGGIEAYVQPRWYAAYTRANHERRVADQLAERGVDNFLPQYSSVRKWKDRRVRLELPLFPGYVFVRLALQNRLRVLQVPGVAHLVSFAGRPVAVPEEEFARIRGCLDKGLRAEPHRYLEAGRRVRVRSGPLEGMEGIVVRQKNSSRLVVSLELIQRAMAVELDTLDLETLK
ncbi:MAG TPA: UpxY family transcription antiterminator [Candidatus Acidoferrum sp.]|jgi:transcription antitermination factor NusG